MVCATITGLDDIPVLKLAKARGWMSRQEMKIVQDRAAEMLKNSGEGRSIAWQVAALALAQGEGALSQPLSIHFKGARSE